MGNSIFVGIDGKDWNSGMMVPSKDGKATLSSFFLVATAEAVLNWTPNDWLARHFLHAPSHASCTQLLSSPQRKNEKLRMEAI
jgi:hypothetical protein